MEIEHLQNKIIDAFAEDFKPKTVEQWSVFYGIFYDHVADHIENAITEYAQKMKGVTND